MRKEGTKTHKEKICNFVARTQSDAATPSTEKWATYPHDFVFFNQNRNVKSLIVQ